MADFSPATIGSTRDSTFFSSMNFTINAMGLELRRERIRFATQDRIRPAKFPVFLLQLDNPGRNSLM
ncbi:hypothetical protein [Pengzhenrongella phosphoraccumulans]|uniref:hypothetical protein n=1 Tax=Pengzhenrongella phosphoraccumulans TaxID=3114394 RepID=UPI00388D7579